jgi:hypothetical protein
MDFWHISKHLTQGVHVRYTHRKLSKQCRKVAQVHTDDSFGADDFLDIMASSMDVDPCDTLPSMVPVSAADNEHSESEPVAPVLSGHLDQMIGDCTFRFNEGPLDLFAELEAIIASGGIPFSMPLAPINNEQEFLDDSAPDFGIELPGE